MANSSDPPVSDKMALQVASCYLTHHHWRWLFFNILWLLPSCLTPLCAYSLSGLGDVLSVDPDLECLHARYADHLRASCGTNLYNVSLRPEHTVSEHCHVIGKNPGPCMCVATTTTTSLCSTTSPMLNRLEEILRLQTLRGPSRRK